MDRRIRELERAGDFVRLMRARMCTGELTYQYVALRAHLGDRVAAQLIVPMAVPCRGMMCIRHFANGIDDAGYGLEAKYIAQKYWCDTLKKRFIHKENTLWFEYQNELALLEAIRNSEDGYKTQDLLMRVADQLHLRNDTIIWHLTRHLLRLNG